MRKASGAATQGVGFSGLIGLIFVTLKIFGAITWPWVWVLAPFWIPWVIILAAFLVMVCLALIIGGRK